MNSKIDTPSSTKAEFGERNADVTLVMGHSSFFRASSFRHSSFHWNLRRKWGLPRQSPCKPAENRLLVASAGVPLGGNRIGRPASSRCAAGAGRRIAVCERNAADATSRAACENCQGPLTERKRLKELRIENQLQLPRLVLVGLGTCRAVRVDEPACATGLPTDHSAAGSVQSHPAADAR